MGLFIGSMNHTYSGRKKKRLSTAKKKRTFSPLKVEQPYRRETPDYPSVSVTAQVANTSATSTSYKREISSKYTIAPAYNKGAYQVISRENIKDIGK